MGLERGSWNWGISFILTRCAAPNLLRRSPLLHRTRLPSRAMLLLRSASRGKTLLSSPMERCVAPASQKLLAHEHRREADGSLRVVYGASIRSCRPYRLREQCQWNGSATAKPRQVSVLLHPLQVGSAPLRLRATGAGESTGAPASSSCDTNAWR
jgi:hypothetical protein